MLKILMGPSLAKPRSSNLQQGDGGEGEGDGGEGEGEGEGEGGGEKP